MYYKHAEGGGTNINATKNYFTVHANLWLYLCIIDVLYFQIVIISNTYLGK